MNDSYSKESMSNTLRVLQTMTRQMGKSQYGQYFVLKGGVALASILDELGLSSYMRFTHDIDLHVCSLSAWESFKADVSTLLNTNQEGIHYYVTQVKDRSKTSGSICLSAVYKGTGYNIKIDMNVAPLNIISTNYIQSVGMYTYDFETMLADKISAVCSQKIFRRIKDLYDIYMLSKLKAYSYVSILSHINSKRPEFLKDGTNMFVPQNYDMLQHAYEKFKGINSKPDFDLLYKTCNSFVYPFISKGTIQNELVWNGDKWVPLG